MTYLEKARELRPNQTDREIIYTCPDCFYPELEKETQCILLKEKTAGSCKRCWSREMPNKNNESEE